MVIWMICLMKKRISSNLFTVTKSLKHLILLSVQSLLKKRINLASAQNDNFYETLNGIIKRPKKQDVLEEVEQDVVEEVVEEVEQAYVKEVQQVVVEEVE